MKTVAKGRHLIREHIWFEPVKNINSVLEQSYSCDEIIIHGNQSEIHGKNITCELQLSLFHDLSLEIDDIQRGFSKTLKNEINRSERELTKCLFYESDEILNDSSILVRFSQMYKSMYEMKGIQGQHLDVETLKSYAENNALLVTAACIENKIVVFHSYIFDRNNCRLLHSCSEFRAEDNFKRNAIGRANKYLHWNDMLFFKKRGLIKYDWGGVSSFESPNGIDKFKLSFGGKSTTYFNIKISISMRMKLLSFCLSFFNKKRII